MSEVVYQRREEAFEYHQRYPWWLDAPGHRKGPWVMYDMGWWICFCECGASRIMYTEASE